MAETKRITKVVCDYVGVKDDIIIEDVKVHSDKVILVVDDSDIVRNFVKRIFNDLYEVRLANDGKDALNYIENDSENKIIGMLLDLNMPGTDGFAVLEYLKTNNLLGKVPVSIITGDDDMDNISKAFEYNIIDVLKKPFTVDNIKKIVDKTISIRSINNM